MVFPTVAFRTARHLLLPVGSAMVLAVTGLYAVRRAVSADALREANDVVGNYLQTLGGVYAVLLAFVVFVVWSQFNEVRSLVDREANEVQDLHRTVGGLPDTLREPVQAAIVRYVRTVLADEWPAMDHCHEVRFDGASRMLETSWSALCAFDPLTDTHRALYTEALGRFNDLSDTRSLRRSAASTRIPLALRMLLYSGATVVVGSMYLFAVRSFAVHAIITGALAGSLSHVLYVIEDLDRPFGGDWQVSRAAWERAARYVEGHPR